MVLQSFNIANSVIPQISPGLLPCLAKEISKEDQSKLLSSSQKSITSLKVKAISEKVRETFKLLGMDFSDFANTKLIEIVRM